MVQCRGVSFLLFAVINISAAAAFAPNIASSTPDKLSITSGVASGDITDNSAIIWSRTNAEARFQVEYGTDPNFTTTVSKSSPSTTSNTTDFTAHLKLDNLNSNTTYYYRVWFSSPDDKAIRSETITGKFRTAPDPLSSSRTIRFIAAGDLGGQQYCRRVDLGYPIFYPMRKLSPDFFIFIGDQIYGDEYCTKNGPAENVSGWNNIPGDFRGVLHKAVDWNNETQLHEVYNKHWAYNRDDHHLQEFLKNVPLYSQADDHEVANNWGNWSYFNNATKYRGSFHNVVKAGLDAFFSYSPIEKNQSDPYHIYRSFKWGKDLELFLLDAHSYRSRNDLPNTYANKTLLGENQLRWLEQSLLNSKATWKVVAMTVPMTIPLCSKGNAFGPVGCDNWATSFAQLHPYSFIHERNKFLQFLVDNNIKNVIFITTDVHFAANIKINAGRGLAVHELVSGPLSARQQMPPLLDPTIDANYVYKETDLFNFGYYEIQNQADGKAHFIARIYGEDGLVRPGSYLDLTPQ